MFEKEHGYTAYVYAAAANVFLVVMQINIKVVSRYISPLHALAIRGFFLLLMNSVVIHYNSMTINVKSPSSTNFPLTQPSYLW